MSFEDELARMAGAVSDHLGRPATFTPQSGAPVSCRVQVLSVDLLAGLDIARAVAADARIKVVASVLPHAPKKGETFTVGATVYRCVDKARRREDDALFYTVDVEVQAA